MKQSENPTELVIVSDGQRTAAFFDGCFYGVGVERLEFVADAKSGTPTVTFNLTNPDMGTFSAERSKELFWEMLQGFEKKEPCLFQEVNKNKSDPAEQAQGQTDVIRSPLETMVDVFRSAIREDIEKRGGTSCLK